MPTTLANYQNKYQCARFERRDGILQMTLHTDGTTTLRTDSEHLDNQSATCPGA